MNANKPEYLSAEGLEKLKAELDKVKRTRALHRAGRAKVPYPIVAIVGYTNAGKSTLFNHLTGADVLSEDQVFATLDPTMRERELPSGKVTTREAWAIVVGGGLGLGHGVGHRDVVPMFLGHPVGVLVIGAARDERQTEREYESSVFQGESS